MPNRQIHCNDVVSLEPPPRWHVHHALGVVEHAYLDKLTVESSHDNKLVLSTRGGCHVTIPIERIDREEPGKLHLTAQLVIAIRWRGPAQIVANRWVFKHSWQPRTILRPAGASQ
jgi:hypothetical protein